MSEQLQVQTHNAAALPETMTAAVMVKPGEIVLEQQAVPQPAADEVLVKIMAVGVCGSDVHYYEHGRIGPYVVEKPLILGHECAGIVMACGADVRRFQPGDRVAVEPGVTCGVCSYCKGGRYNLCPDVQFLATPPVDGAFVQYITHRQDFLFPIPDHVSYEEAAMVEPLSVGIHALNRAGFQPGGSVAVIGAGPVGLLAVSAARAYGASRIIVSDLEEKRLQAALALGATDVVPGRAGDPAAAILELTGGTGVDTSIETAGHPLALKTALAVVRRGGKLSIVGLPPVDEVGLPIADICDKEVDIFGIFRYTNTYEQAVRFLSAGAMDILPMVTDRYPLEAAQEALERALTNKQGSLKVMVYPNGMPE